ncbi:hypothetical protein NDU88_000791 [Pleurodeles waltl]|uniref:Uncharacterized protein n=1 Tax=Pleurodeles waltl TaxID=8319 RepID=A0AAV7SYC0_PLEWA|nr:hypothetical protein NDU88_000791 [Pleurodeles waltl]
MLIRATGLRTALLEEERERKPRVRNKDDAKDRRRGLSWLRVVEHWTTEQKLSTHQRRLRRRTSSHEGAELSNRENSYREKDRSWNPATSQEGCGSLRSLEQ